MDRASGTANPTETIEDGEEWVRSLPEAISDVYLWARFVEGEDADDGTQTSPSPANEGGSLRTDGYYIRKDNHPGRIYHDPSRYFKSTGNPCPMLHLHIESYAWVEKVPDDYKLCGRCPK